MKRLLIAVVLLTVLGIGLIAFLNRGDDSPGAAPQLAGAPASADVMARGEYLTRAADCEACHTVPGSGQAFAGGVAFHLPFGTLYSTNITADSETGIGRWSDDEFVRAVRDGVRADGAHLYPVHPYTSYTQLARSDVLAMKSYLLALPAIRQADRPNALGFPFSQRWAVGLWKAAFFTSRRFAADPSKSPLWNSGAYLAIALGHCGECHTPRNPAFGLRQRQALAGEAMLGWRAYNITSDRKYGIGSWSDHDIAEYLRTGHANWRGSAAGPMGEAVEYSLQFLDDADLAALVTYLRSVPAQRDGQPVEVDALPAPALASTGIAPGADRDPHAQGVQLFAGACASCHLWNGKGLETQYASLIGTRGVNDVSGLNVTQAILNGVQLSIGGREVFMPAFGASYSDAEVAALANYVIGHFGNKQSHLTPEEVARLRTP